MTGTTQVVGERNGSSTFDEAARRVLDHLGRRVPLQVWAVSRRLNGRQIYLRTTDNELGARPGTGPAWSDSLCSVMWEMGGPRIVPDVAQVDLYADRPATRALGIACYVGLPITDSDGDLFGTLCAIDTTTQPAALLDHQEELALLSDLLSLTMRAEVQRQEVERRLEWLRLEADTDPLTGLGNRRSWTIACRSEDARHRQIASMAGVVLLDLDDLKLINDEHGHAAGDEYLRRTAAVLRAHSRATDHVARFGGDEFGVLCPLTDADGLAATTTRLTAALAENGVRASVGAACFGLDTDVRQALEAADAQMYADKRLRRAGRDGRRQARLPKPAGHALRDARPAG